MSGWDGGGRLVTGSEGARGGRYCMEWENEDPPPTPIPIPPLCLLEGNEEEEG